MRKIIRATVIIQVTACLAACDWSAGRNREGDAAPAPGPNLIVATVGDTPVRYASFEKYLVDNAVEDISGEDQESTIKSSLLDQFLEERILLEKARGIDVIVSEAEVDAYLEQIGVSAGEADAALPGGAEAFREKVREGLILQKVKEESVLSKVEVTPGEVEDYLKKQPNLLRTSRMIALRQILVDDRMLAERLSKQLSTDPAQFEAVAREHSVAPDRGQVRTYSEEELPVDLRDSLFALEPGMVSGVLDYARRYLIFQMVRKSEASSQDPEEAKRRVELELFQSKSEQALKSFIADLKSETEIRVNFTILPFKYVGEYRN